MKQAGVDPAASPEKGDGRILVWPWPLRVIHWSLAACVLVAWFTPNTYDTLHRIVGYSALALVGLRVILGFLGPPHVRFSHMCLTVMGTLGTAGSRSETSMREARLGLTPMGAMMAFTLLLLLAVCSVTGWMQVTERYFGIAWVQDTHTYTSYALAALIPLHVLGVLVTSAKERENLVRGMLTGRRRKR